MTAEKRLIDANELCDLCMIRKGSSGCYSCIVYDAPTVDAVEVVHGRWIDRTKNVRGYYDYRYDCSVCEHIFWHGGIENFNYCPICGAKMDGDGNG